MFRLPSSSKPTPACNSPASTKPAHPGSGCNRLYGKTSQVTLTSAAALSCRLALSLKAVSAVSISLRSPCSLSYCTM